MGTGSSVNAEVLMNMSPEDLASKVETLGPAYSIYRRAIVDNAISGQLITHKSHEEFSKFLSDLGVSSLHSKVFNIWC